MGVWTPGPGPTEGSDTFVGDGTGETASGLGGNDVMHGNGGNDTLDGDDGEDQLFGGSGDDDLSGRDGDDTIVGGEGADTMDGDAGADTMTGGLGDDFYTVDSVGDVVVENDAEGIDTISASISYSLADLDFVENLILMRLFDPSILDGSGNGLNNTITGNQFNNVLSGAAGDDILNGDSVGDSGADTLNGDDGNDTLNGGGGDDSLIGGAGADQINGEAGNDTIAYAIGDGADTIDGGADADTLNLSDGVAGNILNASYNGAALTALAGNGLSNLETVNANMGGGTDWLIYSAAAAATVNLALGTASGFASIAGIERVVGGSGGDSLTGDGADNRLDGATGDDTLVGGAGVDTLIGGEGLDSLSGGLGNDSIQGGAGDDTINWTVGDGRDTIDGGADVDAFNPLGSFAADLGNVTWNGTSLTALMDNGLANLESINLDLEGGIDWLIYNATAAVSVNLLLGSASGFVFISDIEKVIGGSGDDTLTGNGGDNRLDGQGGADTLDGGAGSDAVLGGNGDDVIYASAGNDSLQGQSGADTFHWTSADGRDTFNGGADEDMLNITASAVNEVANVNWNGSEITGLLNNALISIETVNLDMGLGDDWLVYNATAGVEVNLSVGLATGFNLATAIENVIGGSGDDVITGNEFGNKINGAAGADTITGGGGNDNLTGGAGSDTFVYAAGAGNDTIIDFDAWDAGGQDFLDVSAFGVNAGNFAARVAIIDTGADTVIRIDDTYFITLKNVTGDGDNSISQADFIFGP